MRVFLWRKKGVASPQETCYTAPVPRLKEELAPNEEVVAAQQRVKIIATRGKTTNVQRHMVSAGALIAWHLLALLGLNLWLLRLLGVIELPF